MRVGPAFRSAGVIRDAESLIRLEGIAEAADAGSARIPDPTHLLSRGANPASL